MLHGYLPNFAFVMLPQREEGASQIFLTYPPKYIALIFHSIQAFGNIVPPFMLLKLSVVSGGNVVAVEFVGSFKQGFPFDEGIAEDARIWGTSNHIFRNKIAHNTFFKLSSNINNVMRKTL